MDRWDRLLVGDSRRERERPASSLESHWPDKGEDRVPGWQVSPKCASNLLDFSRSQSTTAPDRDVVLQAASRGKGAVIWRQSNSHPQSQTSGMWPGMRQPAVPVLIEHTELWSRWSIDDSPEILSARGNIPLLSRGTPDANGAQATPLRLKLFPAPLPLHDFSKDRHDTLPNTGHLQLLPAPKHTGCTTLDAAQEFTADLTLDARAALKERRRRAISMRNDDCKWTEIFSKNAKGRGIKMATAADAAWLQGFKATSVLNATERAGRRGETSDASPDLPAPMRIMDPCYSLSDGNDETLIFESRFECGNLGRAFKIRENEYDLELSTDIKTRGHTQWFYFSVRNMRQGKTYVMNITNFCKRDSLYNTGLRPLMYSETRARQEGRSWSRCAKNISYFSNPKSNGGGVRSEGTTGGGGGGGGGLVAALCADSGRGDDEKHERMPEARKRDESRFTLSFEVDFPHDGDTVYLAHCFPYSYRDLQEHLDSLEADACRRKFIRRRVLTKTIANNDLDVITITSGSGTAEEQLKRPVVVMSARVCTCVSVDVSLCVCVRLSIYLCLWVRVHLLVCVRVLSTRIYYGVPACICLLLYLCLHMCLYKHRCRHIYLCVCVFASLCLNIHTYMWACMRVRG